MISDIRAARVGAADVPIFGWFPWSDCSSVLALSAYATDLGRSLVLARVLIVRDDVVTLTIAGLAAPACQIARPTLGPGDRPLEDALSDGEGKSNAN